MLKRFSANALIWHITPPPVPQLSSPLNARVPQLMCSHFLSCTNDKPGATDCFARTTSRYTPVFVDGFDRKRSGQLYSSIYKEIKFGTRVRHGMSSSTYSKVFKQAEEDGYRLAPSHPSAYSAGKETRFAAVFTKDPGYGNFMTRHGLSASKYQEVVKDMVAKGCVQLRVLAAEVRRCTFRAVSVRVCSFDCSSCFWPSLLIVHSRPKFDLRNTFEGTGSSMCRSAR